MSKDKDIVVGKIEQLTERSLPDSAMPVKRGARDDKGELLEKAPIKKYDPHGEIKKYGLAPTEVVEYKDPFTGTMKKIMIDRRGTTDEKLALALLDDSIPREQKDTMISMYLFEKGKQGASMLMDLWGYKGQHTKESRHFQSQMRFDFDLFLNAFEMFCNDSADLVFKNLPIEIVEVEEEVDGKVIKKEVVKVTRDVTPNEIAVVLGDFGRYHRMTGTLLSKRIRAEVQKRERAKGKGIYIGMDNKPYSVHEDGDIVEVVSKDREQVVKERETKEETAERVKAGVCVKCEKPALHDSLYCEAHEQK